MKRVEVRSYKWQCPGIVGFKAIVLYISEMSAIPVVAQTTDTVSVDFVNQLVFCTGNSL